MSNFKEVVHPSPLLLCGVLSDSKKDLLILLFQVLRNVAMRLARLYMPRLTVCVKLLSGTVVLLLVLANIHLLGWGRNDEGVEVSRNCWFRRTDHCNLSLSLSFTPFALDPLRGYS